MTEQKDVDYSQFTPDFSEKEVQDSIKRKVAEDGVYLWRVTGAYPKVSKADKPTAKGWQMIEEELTALRPSDRAPSMLTVRTWTLLPLMPDPRLLQKSGYEGTPVYYKDNAGTPERVELQVSDVGQYTHADGTEPPQGAVVVWEGRIGEILANFDPNGYKNLTLEKFKERMRAFDPNSIPRLPQANTVPKAAFQEALADQLRIVKTFARELWRNVAQSQKQGAPSMLHGTEFYGSLQYEVDKEAQPNADGEQPKRDMPTVKYPRHVSDPPKVKGGGSLKPILDPFISYK